MKYKCVEPVLVTAQNQQIYRLVSIVDTEFLYVEGAHCATYTAHTTNGRKERNVEDSGILCSLRNAVEASKKGDITGQDFSEHGVSVELPVPFGFKNEQGDTIRYYTEEQVENALKSHGVGLAITY